VNFKVRIREVGEVAGSVGSYHASKAKGRSRTTRNSWLRCQRLKEQDIFGVDSEFCVRDYREWKKNLAILVRGGLAKLDFERLSTTISFSALSRPPSLRIPVYRDVLGHILVQ
jgi:hypothetical protein